MTSGRCTPPPPSPSRCKSPTHLDSRTPPRQTLREFEAKWALFFLKTTHPLLGHDCFNPAAPLPSAAEYLGEPIAMLIVMRPDATAQDIERVNDEIRRR